MSQQTHVAKTLIFAALSSVVFGIAGFVLGLVLQNAWFPSEISANGVWFLYFVPFMALIAVGIGIILGLVAIWAQAKHHLKAGFVIATLIAIIAGGFATFGHYWLAGILVFCGLSLSYQLARRAGANQ